MKHKYKVNDTLWCGNTLVKILRILDNRQYQVGFDKWFGKHWAILKESELSSTKNDNIRLDCGMKTVTVRKRKYINETRSLVEGIL